MIYGHMGKQESPLFPEEGLKESTRHKGRDLKEVADRDQLKLVEFIVETVWSKLKSAPLIEVEYNVGLGSFVGHLLRLLDLNFVHHFLVGFLDWVDSARQLLQRLSIIEIAFLQLSENKLRNIWV